MNAMRCLERSISDTWPSRKESENGLSGRGAAALPPALTAAVPALLGFAAQSFIHRQVRQILTK